MPEGEYGLYFTLFNFAFIFQVVSDFGLYNFNARHVAQSRHLLSKYFPHLLSLKLSLGLVFLSLLAVAGSCWGFSGLAWWLLVWIGFNQVLQTLVLFLRSNLAGLGLYRVDSWASIIDKSLLILILGAMLWMPKLREVFELSWFVGAHTAAYLLTSVGLLLYLSPQLGPWRLSWNWTKIRTFLRAGAPYALVVFLMTAYTRLDAVMISKLLPDGLVQADRYAAAFRLLDAANVGGVLLAGLLLPMFARLLQQHNSVVPLVRLAFGVVWTGAISLAIGVWYYADPIMDALYVHTHARSGPLLRWIILTFVPMSGIYVYGTLLTANGELRPMNLIFGFSIGLNLVLNLLLIPTYGALGAAWATFATQSMAFLAQWYLAQRLLALPSPGFWLWRFAALAAALFLFGRYCLPSLPIHSWYVKFGLLIALGPLVALSLQLWHPKDWWQQA
ncbi:MAG: polysaccharide biosynthesis protein [Bacteroidetes bacterium]|nr:MAG: polysaccharide biosynthesis protein [Bacteroidota bacterium]